MPASFEQTRGPRESSGSLADRVPGWLVSVGIHVGLFFLLMSTMKGCGGEPTGEAGEEFRAFGVFIDDAPPSPEDSPLTESEQTAETEFTENVDKSVDAEPPKELVMPDTSMPVIGQGPPPLPPQSLQGDMKQVVKPGGALVRGSLGLGPGETAFVDIKASGKRFVYVIDCSASMGGASMIFAQEQLKASLRLLQRDQNFQVIFYNQAFETLLVPREPARGGLYPATERNVSFAEGRISRVVPISGTVPFPALNKALEFKPDVIFFLTDGGSEFQPPYKLHEFTAANNGSARVHCIEFGEGDGDLASGRSRWLRKLSSSNNGVLKYINTERLGR